MEVGVVVDLSGEPVHWHLPPHRTSVALPDDRGLWEIFWENRKTLAGFAHSHPGSGRPGPSHTDITTFAAIEAALGQRLRWWITSTDVLCEFRWCGPGVHDYEGWISPPEKISDIWVKKLRDLSY